MEKLRTNRGLLKTILLSAITFGIYALVVYCHMSSEINKIASKYDNKHTMFFLWVCLLSGLTLGILPLVWIHKFCNRIDAEMTRRGIEHKFSAKTWWGWGFFGSLIIVGPFIFMYRLFKNFNALCANFNEKGE